MRNPISEWFRRRRDEDALIRAHTLLVDEALAAQAKGAPIATVAHIVTGRHRTQLASEGHRERAVATRLDRAELPR